MQANWTGPPLGDELKRIVDTVREPMGKESSRNFVCIAWRNVVFDS